MLSARSIALALAGLAITAVVAWTADRERQNGATGRPTPSSMASPGPGASAREPAPIAAGQRPAARAVFSASPRVGDPLSGARTDAEVAWLARNGYPSTEAARDALLRGGARGGFAPQERLDPAAILDAEQLALRETSRRAEAMDFLAASAQAGSIYALETLARIHDQGVDGIADPRRASAYRKAAELRGSWPSALVGDRTPLTRQQQMQATLMAHQIIANLDRERQANGLPPLGIDTRPGLDELITGIGTRGGGGAF